MANRNTFKTLKCKVFKYDEKTKILDVDFAGYGVRIYNVNKCVGDFVQVKYKGEIGSKDFVCKA